MKEAVDDRNSRKGTKRKTKGKPCKQKAKGTENRMILATPTPNKQRRRNASREKISRTLGNETGSE